MLDGHRIIVGLTGGIACYKICTLVSTLAQRGAEVTCAMTPAAAKFIAPLTFEALSGRPAYTSAWDHVETHDPQHIALARNAHAMLVAPCTMDMLARLAHGHTDDIVSLLVASIDRTQTPVLVAPSMNATMYAQPATRRNLEMLAADGFTIIPPATGWQACRTEGEGRLPEPDDLMAAIKSALGPR